MKNKCYKYSLHYLLLFIVVNIIISTISTNIIESYNIFNFYKNEYELLWSDISIYSNNITSIYALDELKKLRKVSKYRKKGYGGHPQKYIISFPLDEKIILSPNIENGLIELLVFIHCRPDEFYERFISRKVLSNLYYDYLVIYITSKSERNDVNYRIKKEANMYNDILQFNEISSYFNLTIQTIHMLKYSSNFKYKYLLKTDIDVYINVKLLLKLLHRIETNKKYYALGKISNTYVIRNKKYSHYIPYEVINENIYPPYLQGVGYVIPYRTVMLICKTIEYVKPALWIEDVFMGYVFKYNNISLIDLSGYIVRDIPHNINKIYNSVNKYILVHGFYPAEILFLNSL